MICEEIDLGGGEIASPERAGFDRLQQRHRPIRPGEQHRQCRLAQPWRERGPALEQFSFNSRIIEASERFDRSQLHRLRLVQVEQRQEQPTRFAEGGEAEQLNRLHAHGFGLSGIGSQSPGTVENRLEISFWQRRAGAPESLSQRVNQ